MDDQMFRTVMRGFDKDEVFAYIKQIEEDANQKVAEAKAEAEEKDKLIAELNQRIANKDAKYERLENEVEVKYRKYIDNYEKIGSLVYESKVKGDKIIADAEAEAARITAESKEKYDRKIAEADLAAETRLSAAQTRLDSVQKEIDARIEEGEKQYAKVQADMREIVSLLNETQEKFMRAYKEVNEAFDRMPESLDDLKEDEPERLVNSVEKPEEKQSEEISSEETPVVDDLDDYDNYDDSDFDSDGVHFSFGDFVIEDDEYEEEAPVQSQMDDANAVGGDTIDFSRVSGMKLNYEDSMPLDFQGINMEKAPETAPPANTGFSGAFADEGTFRLPGEKI